MKAPKAKSVFPYEVLVRKAAVKEAYRGFVDDEAIVDAIYRIVNAYEVTFKRAERDVNKVKWEAAIAVEEGIESAWVKTGKLPKELA